MSYLSCSQCVYASQSISTLFFSPSGHVVTIPGRNSTFTCFQLFPGSNTQLQNVAWLVNGSALENYGTDNIITAPGPSNSEILTFINLSLENNGTTIQCQATLQSNVTQSASEGVLLLQGIKVAG